MLVTSLSLQDQYLISNHLFFLSIYSDSEDARNFLGRHSWRSCFFIIKNNLTVLNLFFMRVKIKTVKCFCFPLRTTLTLPNLSFKENWESPKLIKVSKKIEIFDNNKKMAFLLLNNTGSSFLNSFVVDTPFIIAAIFTVTIRSQISLSFSTFLMCSIRTYFWSKRMSTLIIKSVFEKLNWPAESTYLQSRDFISVQ